MRDREISTKIGLNHQKLQKIRIRQSVAHKVAKKPTFTGYTDQVKKPITKKNTVFQI